jgi:hypothetical protein
MQYKEEGACQYCDEGDIYDIKDLVIAFKKCTFDRDTLIMACRDIICGWKYSKVRSQIFFCTVCPVCLGTGKED